MKNSHTPCALLKTALLNKQEVHILGLDLEPNSEGYMKTGHGLEHVTRMISNLTARYTCTLPKNYVVLGADAYDTLFSSTANSEHILNVFSSFQSEFVWSAETSMYPRFDELPNWVRASYPEENMNKVNFSRKSEYKYLNYGGYIGKQASVCSVLERCAEQLRNCSLCVRECNELGLKSYSELPHDQAAAQLILSSGEFNSSLDFRQRLFHPVLHSNGACSQLVVDTKGVARVIALDSNPIMYHFHGGAKYAHVCLNYYSKGWFTTKALGRKAQVTVIGIDNKAKRVSASYICPNIPRQLRHCFELFNCT